MGSFPVSTLVKPLCYGLKIDHTAKQFACLKIYSNVFTLFTSTFSKRYLKSLFLFLKTEKNF